MGSVAFLKACLGWIGGTATIAAGVAFVLDIGQRRSGAAPGRLGGTWAKIASTPWPRLGRRAASTMLAVFDRAIERGFKGADETIVGNVVFIGIVFVALPGLAIVNALVGGSPRLGLYCLSLAAVFAVLNFTGERGSLGGFNSLAALYLGVGFHVGIPLYVLHSFSDRLLKEVIDHAVIESLMVAPLVFILAHSGFALFGTIAGRRTGPAVAIEPVAAFAAALPIGFVLTFVALFLGALAEAPESLGQSWSLLLAAMTCGATALPTTLGCLAAALRSSRAGALVGAIVASLVAALALATILWWWAYQPAALSFDAMAATMVGLTPDGQRLYFGPEFWILHLPVLPAFVVLAGLGTAFSLKAIATLLDRLVSRGFAARRPLGATGLGLAIVAALAIAGSL